MLNGVFWRHVPLEIEFKVVAQAAMHSGNTHERQSNFRHRKKKENRKNRARRIYNSATPYGQAE